MAQTNLRLPEQNSVTIVGRLTRDPDVRFTAKGQAVCRFDLAVNRRYKDNSGNWQDDTSFVPVVVWGDAASRCGERLKKGLPAHVEGRLQSRAWETKDGQKRTTLEVIARRVQFLSKVAAVRDSEEEGTVSQATENQDSPSNDEEIPF
ncbi:MAG: single-stranded DNA-binding protein [Endomicrobiales bacterium]|nr:single-stranded DNA-binding protein [Endomicrobiales bacterium]